MTNCNSHSNISIHRSSGQPSICLNTGKGEYHKEKAIKYLKTFVHNYSRRKGTLHQFLSHHSNLFAINKTNFVAMDGCICTYIVSCAKYFTNFINEFRSQNVHAKCEIFFNANSIFLLFK